MYPVHNIELLVLNLVKYHKLKLITTHNSLINIFFYWKLIIPTCEPQLHDGTDSLNAKWVAYGAGSVTQEYDVNHFFFFIIYACRIISIFYCKSHRLHHAKTTKSKSHIYVTFRADQFHIVVYGFRQNAKPIYQFQESG